MEVCEFRVCMEVCEFYACSLQSNAVVHHELDGPEAEHWAKMEHPAPREVILNSSKHQAETIVPRRRSLGWWRRLRGLVRRRRCRHLGGHGSAACASGGHSTGGGEEATVRDWRPSA